MDFKCVLSNSRRSDYVLNWSNNMLFMICEIYDWLQCDGYHIPHNPMGAIGRSINVIHYHMTRMWSSYNLFLLCRRFVVDMDIKNRQSRNTGNIRYTRHRTKEKNHQHPEEQHEHHLKSGMNPCGRDG